MDGGGWEVVRSGGAFVDVRGLKVVACYILEWDAHIHAARFAEDCCLLETD